MDNFSFFIQSDSREDFELAMKLVFSRHKYVAAYEVHDIHGLILYSAKDNGKQTALPYLMDLEDVLHFAWGWVQKADCGPEPDLDGAFKHAFRVCFDGVDAAFVGSHYVAAIRPVWALYHK